jgi:hypothetical protein
MQVTAGLLKFQAVESQRAPRLAEVVAPTAEQVPLADLEVVALLQEVVAELEPQVKAMPEVQV